MSQKCLTTIFSSEKALNSNMNLTICQKHQKPLSYYNKYKPGNDSICIDCLINEIKEGKEQNLYLPISNLEQEYYDQKNTFFQIIEQANNLKKYESYINNFEILLSNYFSKFIGKFIRQKIFDNIPQKKIEIYQKYNTVTSKDIMNVLYNVEKEKYIVDNKTIDVFCHINKMQTIFIKNHDKLEKSFNDLLNGFFDDSIKTQSNEIFYQNDFVQSSPSLKSRDNLPSTQYGSKTSKDDNISQISSVDDLKSQIYNKIQEISNFASNFQKNNMENNEFDNKDEIKRYHFSNEINNNFLQRKKCELDADNNTLKISEETKAKNEFGWQRKKYGEDENSPINQNQKLNSFKSYSPSKFDYSKNAQNKKYNQIIQKICRKCCTSFETTKNEEFCQKCKYISDDDEDGRINKRGTIYFSHKRSKFGFFPKYFNGPKKARIQTHMGNKKYFGNKNVTLFYRNFGNKSLISSKKNFLNRYGKRISSPKDCKYNFYGKYPMNKRNRNYNNHFEKNALKEKKNYERRAKDDFEVDLDLESDGKINNKSGFGESNLLDKNENNNEEKKDDFFGDNKNNESKEKNEISEKFSKLENAKENDKDNDRFKNNNADNEDDDFECDF